jgi:UDP-2-acetamido-2,6-beta-L-arabino-hexul-4-ose reductase
MPNPPPEPEPIKVSRDSRGLVFEPLDAATLAEQRNVHVTVTEPGAIRGNHYHLQSAEVLAVIGPALVRVRHEGRILDYPVAAGEVRRCVVPPGVAHAIRHDGPHPGFLISFRTKVFDPANPDTYRDVLIEPPG